MIFTQCLSAERTGRAFGGLQSLDAFLELIHICFERVVLSLQLGLPLTRGVSFRLQPGTFGQACLSACFNKSSAEAIFASRSLKQRITGHWYWRPVPVSLPVHVPVLLFPRRSVPAEERVPLHVRGNAPPLVPILPIPCGIFARLDKRPRSLRRG